ncbi:MAG: sulfatase, partial [Deltaproteobacteria bacterium]|nr:sulfatase [Deltaproteobacteria bacterium]
MFLKNNYFTYLIFTLTLALSGCNSRSDGKGQINDQFPKTENLILIVVDTLRSDRLGCYGFPDRHISPAIDKAANDGIVFKNFYAASPWTAPSFGSIFTGLSPKVHRGGDIDLSNTSDKSRMVKGFKLFKLDTKYKTMAELLKKSVNKTMAVVSNPFLHPLLGYNRGFDIYEYSIKHKTAREVTESSIALLKEHKDKSFFLLAHYMDVHAPYNPPKQFENKIQDFEGNRFSNPFNMTTEEVMNMKPTANEIKFINSLYNAEISYVDSEIGNLLQNIKNMGLHKTSTIIITADHGEEIFDHGSLFHGRQFTNEVIKVPFIIIPPKGKWIHGKNVKFSASQKDILPTVLNIFSIKSETPVEGKSLIPLITGKEKKDRFCYIESPLLQSKADDPQLYNVRKLALFNGRYKLIQSENGKRTYMYDLLKDPLEKHQIMRFNKVIKKMNAQLKMYKTLRKKQFKLSADNTKSQVLPTDVEKALKNLGY